LSRQDPEKQLSKTTALVEEATVIVRQARSAPGDASRVGVAPAVDPGLEQRINDVLREVEEALGHPLERARTHQPCGPADKQLRTALSLACGALRLRKRALDDDRTAKLAACALQLQEVSQDVCDRQLERRVESLRGVGRALGHLEGIDSTQQLLTGSTRELCQTCGFDRAAMFRAEGPVLVAESMEFVGDPAWGRRVLEFARRARPRLDNGAHGGVTRRRERPLLVRDAQDLRSRCPVIAATDTRAYVAAPIMPEGEVIGFLHADRYFAGDSVDELDRDVLAAFAQGFGYMAARIAVVERLRHEHHRLRQLLTLTEASVSRIYGPNVALTSNRGEPRHPERAGAVAGSLTRRQRQIIELMADGATNAEIARRLVLSQETVKFHVREILKRMRAANRAEAVSRYLRCVSQ
jgi:LuxR family transcriptional regulator, regulator of acetate metabolism